MGEKLPRILPKVATSTSLLGSFTCRKFTTWDRRLYFPSEGRRAEDFFARKIRRLRPGLSPRTRVPKASTLTSRPPKQQAVLDALILHRTAPRQQPTVVGLHADTTANWQLETTASLLTSSSSCPKHYFWPLFAYPQPHVLCCCSNQSHCPLTYTKLPT